MSKEEKKTTKSTTVKKWILSIAIAIVFTLFINYSISTFFDEPRYDIFCTQDRNFNATTSTQCEAIGGKWTTGGGYYTKPVYTEENYVTGTCDYDYTCRTNLEQAQQEYQRNGFLVSIITGGIALLLGLFLTLPSVATGLSLGGLLTIFIGTVSYWGYLSKYIRVLILGILLLALIWTGYKKLQE